jgi:hypothetical protein
MATLNTLWTCVGITKHVGANGKEVVKVRCGVDLARRIKSSQSASYVKSRGEKLKEVRTDFISLPTPMLRLDALKFALAAPEFQSSSDQALIQDAIDSRVPKTAKTTKVTATRSSKKTAPSLDSIKSRVRKSRATADDVLAAVVATETVTETV